MNSTLTCIGDSSVPYVNKMTKDVSHGRHFVRTTHITQHPFVVRGSPCVWHIAMPLWAHLEQVDQCKTCATLYCTHHIGAFVHALSLAHKSRNNGVFFKEQLWVDFVVIDWHRAVSQLRDLTCNCCTTSTLQNYYSGIPQLHNSQYVRMYRSMQRVFLRLLYQDILAQHNFCFGLAITATPDIPVTCFASRPFPFRRWSTLVRPTPFWIPPFWASITYNPFPSHNQSS